MPDSPRLPWRVLLVSTALALIAAIATYVVLSGGDGDDTVSPDDFAGQATVSLTPDTGTVAPGQAAFTDFDGKVVALSSLEGTPVVVNFFASYCTPCITEMPAFEKVHQELGSKVTFLGLAVSDRKSEAQALVQRTKVTYRTALDRDGSVIGAFGGTVLPMTVLLDAQGNPVATHNGALKASELRSLLAEKLGVT